VNEPIKLQHTPLTENRKVVSTLFAGRHNHNFFVSVAKKSPQNKRSRNPAFSKSTETLKHHPATTMLKVIGHC
jgi:hypothetical protein